MTEAQRQEALRVVYSQVEHLMAEAHRMMDRAKVLDVKSRLHPEVPQMDLRKAIKLWSAAAAKVRE